MFRFFSCRAAPTFSSPTMAEVAGRYRASQHAPANAADEDALINIVLASLGTLHVTAVTRSQVQAMHDLHEADTDRADRALELAKALFTFAETTGLRPGGTNPCIYITPFRERREALTVSRPPAAP